MNIPGMELFRKETAQDIARKELYEAEIYLLHAQTTHEESSATITFRTAQIERLRAYIKAEHTK